MGLFGKKEKAPAAIRLQYYEGLEGFECNRGCDVQLLDEFLRIVQIGPIIQVKLPRDRILGIDIMEEPQYMAKYKGNAISTSKSGVKTYYIINYTRKDGQNAHLDFWGSLSETIKIEKMKTILAANQQPKSYEI